MFAKTFLSIAAGMIMLDAQVQGAAIPEEADAMVPPRVNIASTPEYACGCPNNCNYDVACKYIAGASSSNVVGGKCGYAAGSNVLTCL